MMALTRFRAMSSLEQSSNFVQHGCGFYTSASFTFSRADVVRFCVFCSSNYINVLVNFQISSWYTIWYIFFFTLHVIRRVHCEEIDIFLVTILCTNLFDKWNFIIYIWIEFSLGDYF